MRGQGAICWPYGGEGAEDIYDELCTLIVDWHELLFAPLLLLNTYICIKAWALTTRYACISSGHYHIIMHLLYLHAQETSGQGDQQPHATETAAFMAAAAVAAGFETNHDLHQHHQRMPGDITVPAKPIENSPSDYLNSFGAYDFAALLAAVAAGGGGGGDTTIHLPLLDEDLPSGFGQGQPYQQQGDTDNQPAAEAGPLSNAWASSGGSAPLAAVGEATDNDLPSNVQQQRDLSSLPPSLLNVSHQGDGSQGQKVVTGGSSAEGTWKHDAEEEEGHHHQKLHRPNFKHMPLVIKK